MGITLAGGAEFPTFDGLIGLGRLIIVIGLIAQIGIGVGRLFRGAAPEFIPALVKATLALFAISHLNEIGAVAHQTGGLLAETIAGGRMEGFLASIESTLVATYNPKGGYFDFMTLEFWFGLASVACMAFAFVSKFIVLEVLWPLYLGLVVISGTFSISMSMLPGMRTAQSWILTLLEAVAWPMIFQILLGIIAVVCDQQVDVMYERDGNFIPLLKGLATLCAVSFLTVMVPILAARMMRGDGASAAMSFVAAKAASMVTGLTARAAVGAVTAPAKAAAVPVRAGLGTGAKAAGGAVLGAASGAASKLADAAPGAALAMSLARRPRPGRAGRSPVQAQSGKPGNSPRAAHHNKPPRTSQVRQAPDGQAVPNVSATGPALPQGSSSNADQAPVSPQQPAATAQTRGDRVKFDSPQTDASTRFDKPASPAPAPKAWPVKPPPPPLDQRPPAGATPASAKPTSHEGSKPQQPVPGQSPRDPSPDAQRQGSEQMGTEHGPTHPQRPEQGQMHQARVPERGTTRPAQGPDLRSPGPQPSTASSGQPHGARATSAAPAAPLSTTARPPATAAPSAPHQRQSDPQSGPPRVSPQPQGPQSGPAPSAEAASGRSSYRNIKGSTAYSNRAYGRLLQTHPEAAARIRAAWKADPPPPKGPGQEPARRARRERIDALTKQVVDSLKEPPK